MALPQLLKDSAVWLAGYDFTGYLNSVNFAAAKAELPSNVFTDGVECYFPGLVSVIAEAGGFWNSESALAPDPVVFDRVKADATPADWPLIVVPGGNTEGNIGYAVVGNQFMYQLGGAHGQLLPFSMKTLPSTGYKLYRQRLERAKASVTATTTSAGFQYGALSAAQQMIVTFHVFLISGTGAWTLTIQSDDNAGFSSATTRAAFTQVDQAGDPAFQVVKISGAITDDYWRAVLTEDSGTSTISFAVSMGIANLT